MSDMDRVVAAINRKPVNAEGDTIVVRMHDGRLDLSIGGSITAEQVLVAGATLTRVGGRIIEAAEAAQAAARAETAAVSAELRRRKQ
jgi:hypothetical protein